MVAAVDDLIAPEAPAWFRRALQTPFFDQFVEVEAHRSTI
jgi:hypothetical protein